MERLGRISSHIQLTAGPPAEVVVDEARLRELCRAVLRAIGSSDAEQHTVADHLVDAMLKGHDSHGVQMLSGYIGSYKQGILRPNADIKVVGQSGPMLTIDGGGFDEGGFGMAAAAAATELAVEVAKEHGCCILMLRNCHHIGRVGTYAEMAADCGMITTLYTNGNQIRPLVSPFGGSSARLATNPYTCGLPGIATDGGSVVLDFATSVVANGKVMNNANKGAKFDDKVLLTRDGVPTNDPSAMWTQEKPESGASRQGGLKEQGGSLIAFGLHKGSGLGLMCSLLAGGLTGGGTELPENQKGPGPILNHLFGVFVDPAAVERAGGASRAAMLDEMSAFIEHYKTARPIDPARPVLAPGESERIFAEDRKTNGIAIAGHTWATLTTTARELGVDDGVISNTLLTT